MRKQIIHPIIRPSPNNFHYLQTNIITIITIFIIINHLRIIINTITIIVITIIKPLHIL